MRFEYKKYIANGSARIRPVIPIELTNGDISVGYEVLIDSGSDICIIDIQIGAILGFNFGKHNAGGHVRGVTGVPAQLYKERMNIKVGGWPYTIDAYFMELAEDSRYGVVGQEGFFDLFVVKFDLIKEQIELQPRK